MTVVADDPLDLFDDGGDAEESAALDVYGQDGPDLFGTEPDELILPPEPVAADDPEVDVEMDTMDEIPIEEPDDDPPQVEPAGSALVRPVETQAPPPRGHRPV